MRTIILVRHNIDWKNMTDGLFYSQGKTKDHPVVPRGVLSLQQCRLPEVWRKLFAVEYYDFRKEISLLAQWQNANVANSIVVYGYEQLKPYLESKEDFMIVPTDDDDFFHPSLGNSLSKWMEEHPKDKFISWPQILLGNNEIHWASRKGATPFRSNCYAVRKSYLANQFAEEARKTVLWMHHAAYVYSKRRAGSLTVLGRHLSLTHKHLGSASFLNAIAVCRVPEVHGNPNPCPICFRESLAKAYHDYAHPVKRSDKAEWLGGTFKFIKTVYDKFQAPKAVGEQ